MSDEQQQNPRETPPQRNESPGTKAQQKKQQRKRKRRSITPNPLFVAVIRPTIFWFLRRLYDIEIRDRDSIAQLEQPYLIVGNHVNFWDPFFLSMGITHVAQFVTSDNIFRTRLLKAVMKLLGSVPTSKFASDTGTVMQIMRILKRPGVIGIFPEGRRTWDGKSLDQVETVARLINRLQMPVAAGHVKGGYLAKPRWAKNRRRGKVIVEFRMLFEPEELKKLGPEETLKVMEERLYHDEYEWQREHMYRYPAKDRAEYIEQVLFICPECTRIGTIRSHGNNATCTSCGHSIYYDEYGFLQPAGNPERSFTTISEWNDWQLEHFRRRLRDMKDEVWLLEEGPAILWTGYRTRPLKRVNTGRAYFSPSEIVFHTNIGKEIRFPLEEIYGENVQDREKLEFYLGQVLYRLDFMSSHASSYMWLQAIKYVHSETERGGN
jgi:1-acyl-sn-glycerol-3-phosphate acyltransferase